MRKWGTGLDVQLCWPPKSGCGHETGEVGAHDTRQDIVSRHDSCGGRVEGRSGHQEGPQETRERGPGSRELERG